MASSAEAEGVASSKSGELAQELAEVKRAVGKPLPGPIVLGTDSMTNGQVARRQGAAHRLKHALRRWETLLERVDGGLVELLHVPDKCMPADFLTKWTSNKKVRESIDYLINVKHKVYHPNDPNKPK